MFNNVTLIGYLGSDAESRTTRNNSTLTVLSLATRRTWRNRETGERQSQTTWHRCVVIWNRAVFSAPVFLLKPVGRILAWIAKLRMCYCVHKVRTYGNRKDRHARVP
jgi:hypothetical protein